MKTVWKGVAASPGIGVGKVFWYRERELRFHARHVADTQMELQRYRQAVDRFCADTEARARLVAATVGEEQAEIIRTHIMMIQDPYIHGQVEGRISSNQCAEAALDAVCSVFLSLFSNSGDELVKQRAADLRDVRDSMLRLLLDVSETDLSGLEPGTVLAAEELTPSVTARIDPNLIVGIVTRKGGKTSHSAILARALEIPAVLGVDLPAEGLKNGELIVVDGLQGRVVLSPDEEELSFYRLMRADDLKERVALKQFTGRKTETADGMQVRLAANVGGPEETKRAAEFGADGVGLLRSEFLYLDQKAPPGEEAQFEAYRKTVLAAGGKPVTIRTLDVGGDKEVPYLDFGNEENPFLGCRAIRISLQKKEMFRIQLKAILRAAAFGEVSILIPFITSLEEIRAVKVQLEWAAQELREEGRQFNSEIRLGVMIETAAAVVMADRLAAETDFFSIGTNDLTQYVLSVDRGNPKVAEFYSYCDPAVLRSIRRAVHCAKEAGIQVGMCGEAASDPLLTPVLLSLGLDTFSVPPSSVLTIRRAISLWTLPEADALTEEAFSLGTEREVRELLEKHRRG